MRLTSAGFTRKALTQSCASSIASQTVLKMRRYDRLVRKADRLNPPPASPAGEAGSPREKRSTPSPARRLNNRLARRRDEVLRFMTDLASGSTTTGRSVTCRW